MYVLIVLKIETKGYIKILFDIFMKTTNFQHQVKHVTGE